MECKIMHGRSTVQLLELSGIISRQLLLGDLSLAGRIGK